MKFFDPKKKEQNSTTYPPSAPPAVPPVPVAQPVPATSTPSAAPLPRPPAAVPAEAARPVSEDTAPTVMIPVPQAKPSVEPAPAPAVVPVPVPEPPPAPPQKPVLVTQRLVPQLTGQTLIGSTVMVKGDVTANESILVDGFVEGAIETTSDVIVGLHGKVYASIRADNIKVSGKVVGNIAASNKVELDATAVLEGNIRAPRLSISESALFRGSIDMRPVVPKEAANDQEKKPASSASVEPA